MPIKSRRKSRPYPSRRQVPPKARAVPYAACLECGGLARKVTGDVLFSRLGADSEHYYLCVCGAYCGANVKTGRPLGRPAGAETRALRGEAHNIFDPIWRERHMTRDEAYGWLAGALGITHLECHIGFMDAPMLRRAIALSGAKLSALRDEA